MTRKKLIITLSMVIVISTCFFIGLHSTNNYTNTNNSINVSQLSKVEIENKLEGLKGDEYEDGTYNLDTLEEISYKTGYQVSFYQVGVDYSDEEFIDIFQIFLDESSDHVISAGKYEGSVEISFNIENKNIAINLAQEFNQISIWDWAANNELIL